MVNPDIEETITQCYHELLEREKKLLEDNEWKFGAASRLTKNIIDSICGKWKISLQELIKRKLLVRYPDGTFRTMHFDIIYRLINVKVTRNGAPIPLEYKVVLRKESLPNFEEVDIQKLQHLMPKTLITTLKKSNIEQLSQYQFEYIKNILSSDEYDAFVASSPTASGKTLIFLIPALTLALEGKRSIFMYPRKALATDQLKFFLKVIDKLNNILIKKKITIGIEDGDTKWENWLKHGASFRSLKCPSCETGDLIYFRKEGKFIIKCKHCGKEYDYILAARDYIWQTPPTILITNIYTLNLRLMNKDTQILFKSSYGKLSLLVLDEAHTYKEELGGHVHYILKRLSTLVGKEGRLKIIISSATLPRPKDFASSLLDIPENKIFWRNYYDFLKTAQKTKMIIHLFLLPNPFRSSETLAEEVLHTLAVLAYATGKKTIFFVDSVPEVRRLYHFVKDIIILKRKAILEHIEIPDVQETYSWRHYFNLIPLDKNKRDKLVKEVAESIGIHYGDLEQERRHKIEQMFKAGEKRTLVSTSTLELGIDIGDVAIIGQYRVPFTNESYQQRVGRAGRSIESYRTALAVLVLSNSPSQIRYLYGEEWQDLLELPVNYKIPLAVDNATIKRMHMFNSMLDILASKGQTTYIYGAETRHWRNAYTVINDIIELIKRAKGCINEIKDYIGKVIKNPPLSIDKLINDIEKRLEVIGKEVLTEIAVERIPRDELLWVKEKIEELKQLSYDMETLTEIFEKKDVSITDEAYAFIKSLKNIIQTLYSDFENISRFVRTGDIESLREAVKKIRTLTVPSTDVKRNLLRIRTQLIRELENRLQTEEDIPLPLIEEIEKTQNEIRGTTTKIIEFFERDFPKLISDGIDLYLLLPYEDLFMMTRRRRYEFFGILDAVKVLGLIPQMSTILSKPLPIINIYYPNIGRIQKSIDRAMYLCTPLRVDIQDIKKTDRREYYTCSFPLRGAQYKIINKSGNIISSYEPFESEQDTFLLDDITITTPSTINMISISNNVFRVFTTERRKGNYFIQLSALPPKNDLWSCQYCWFGLMITSEQITTCKFNNCLLRPECGGTKYFVGPPYSTSYFKLCKIFPILKKHVSKPIIEKRQKILEDLIELCTFKGCIFKAGSIGCTVISSGDMISPPTIWFKKGIGYRINSRGLLIEFNRSKLMDLIKEALSNPEVYTWILVKYIISKKYFKPMGDLNLNLATKFFDSLITGKPVRGVKGAVKNFEKWLSRKKVPEEIYDFALENFLHSLAHVLYQVLVDLLQTNDENLAIYYIDDKDKNSAKIYLVENAEEGIGLTETLEFIIKNMGAKNFTLELLWKTVQIVKSCEEIAQKYRENAIRELEEGTKRLEPKIQEKIIDLKNQITEWINSMKTKYNNIYPPIEIIRYIITQKYPQYGELLSNTQTRQLLSETVLSTVPYCWDGCYLCTRLERSCNYDPFRQMTLVSRSLLLKICEQLLEKLQSRVLIGRNFEDVITAIKSTEQILRISSPWLSKHILDRFVEPLLQRKVKIKILTKKPEASEEKHIEALEYLRLLLQRYQELLEVKLLENLHAKCIIIDDSILFTGSMNLTESGVYRNIEILIRVQEKEIINEAITQFRELWEEAKNLT